MSIEQDPEITTLPEPVTSFLEAAFTEARAESYRAGYDAGIEAGIANSKRVDGAELGIKYSEGHRHGAEEQRGYFIGILKVLADKHPDIVPDLPVDVLDTGLRARNCLAREEVKTLGQLVLRTEDSLLEIMNFGQICLDEVAEGLESFGLSLKQPEVE
jgi:hypothetical protein